MALPIHPVTVPIALRVGQIDGENQAKGVRLPLADLLIGVTALELGYSVATGKSSPLPTGPRPVRDAALVLVPESQPSIPDLAVWQSGHGRGDVLPLLTAGFQG
jgi:hypothetical protein